MNPLLRPYGTFHVSRWRFDRRMLLILGGFWVLAYLLPLAFRPVFRPDETRYGAIAREMLYSGDWVVPRLNGARYFEKPALGHQLNALSFRVFGINRFALRIVPALSVLATMLLLYFLVHSATRDRLLPALAAGFYLANGYVFGIGTFAVLDAQLTAAITACLCAGYGAVNAIGRGRTVLLLSLAGAAAGIAFLLKGLVGVAVPVMAAGVWLLWRRDWRKILLYGWLPLAVALAVILPWSLAIARAEPDFWNYFLIEEHWHRFTSGTYDRSREPFWYFLPILLGGGFPAWIWWIPAARGFARRCWNNDLFRFLFCWAVVPFLFFSASSCKTGTYILPCFPALAGVLAIGVRGAMRRRRHFLEQAQRVFLWIYGVSFILLGLAWFAAPAVTAWLWPESGSVGGSVKMVLAGILTVPAGISLLAVRRAGLGRQWLVMLAALGVTIAAALGALPDAVFGNKTPDRALRECLARDPLQPDDVLIADRVSMSSILWTLQTSGVRIIEDPGELCYAFQTYPEEYAELWIPCGNREKIAAAGARGKRVWITFWEPDETGVYSPGVEPIRITSDDCGIHIIRF